MSKEAARCAGGGVGASAPVQAEQALRKRAAASVESLGTRLSREAAKIIKIRVNQDATNWQLRERVSQLEATRERQQQNLVELQMQYEIRDGEYQDELRLRADTLNKVKNTWSICTVLEEHNGRISETLSRCHADRARLFEAYQKVAQVVRDVKAKHAQAEEAQRTAIQHLQEKITDMSKHKDELAEEWRDNKKTLDIVIKDLNARLNSAENDHKDCLKTVSELNALNVFLKNDIDQFKIIFEQKDRRILELINDLTKVTKEHSTKTDEMVLIIKEQEKHLVESQQHSQALQGALTNQEDFTKTIVLQNKQMQERINTLENENKNVLSQNDSLKLHVENMNTTVLACQNEMASLNQHIKDSAAQAQEKDQAIAHGTIELTKLKEGLIGIENEMASREQLYKQSQNISSQEKADLTDTVDKLTLEANVQANVQAVAMKEIMLEVFNLKSTNSHLQDALKKQSESSERQIAQSAEQQERDSKSMAEQSRALTRLMGEVQRGGDDNGRLRAALERCSGDAAAAAQQQNKLYLEQLAVKDKEIEERQNIIEELKKDLQIVKNENALFRKDNDITGRKMSRSDIDIPRSQPIMRQEAQREEQEHSPRELSPVLSGRTAPPSRQGAGGRALPPERTKEARVTFASPASISVSVRRTRPNFNFDFSDSSMDAGDTINKNRKKVESRLKVAKVPKPLRRKSGSAAPAPAHARRDFSDSSVDGDFCVDPIELEKRYGGRLQQTSQPHDRFGARKPAGSILVRSKRKRSPAKPEHMILSQDKARREDNEPTRDIPVNAKKFFPNKQSANVDSDKRFKDFNDKVKN